MNATPPPESVGDLLARGDRAYADGRFEEALSAYRAAWDREGANPVAAGNTGLAAVAIGRPDQARAAFQVAQWLDPGNPDWRFSLAMLALEAGDFATGFRDYEARFELRLVREEAAFQNQLMAARAVRFLGPADHPAPATVALLSEQGAGDTIQFLRYGAVLRDLGYQVTLVLSDVLARLGRLTVPAIEAISFGDLVAAGRRFDYWSPICSLAFRLGTRLDTVPIPGPYLAADPTEVDIWRQRLDLIGPSSCRIGLVWRSNSKSPLAGRRDIPLAAFAQLNQLPGAQLIAIQQGLDDDALAAACKMLGARAIGPQDDYAATAAALCALDWVVTVDTSVAHLAGALGIPTVLVLGDAGDWRWLRDRADSPWYSALRIIRRQPDETWDQVMVRVTRTIANGKV